MSAIATQVVNELIARLEEIAIANGYATDLPSEVQDEDPALYFDEHTPLPCMGIRNLSDRVTAKSRGATLQQRTVEIVAYLERGPSNRARQDELLQDIYRTVFRPESIKLKGLAVEIVAGEAQLDDIELGSKIIPIYLPIILTYNTLNWS
ncbi:hypothetical protein MIH18_23785 (plasmid) [Marinobacter sp. M3C]|jgi:hypothetical protein|uniref:hypothetical protein n=1 Tax=Marinobacter sp. M3C TaxID=2917715 RepID=UPI00201074C4|nr:hypothetical protein [Marinobacter sp. M3C]MCL1485193.1 hypothetical protein [Marinobacter sp.]UQG62783.1 hypothetical protein MIH18_23785 [Marinobacter sp. M3C]